MVLPVLGLHILKCVPIGGRLLAQSTHSLPFHKIAHQDDHHHNGQCNSQN